MTHSRPGLIAVTLFLVLIAGCLGGPINGDGKITTAPTTDCPETQVTPVPYPEIPMTVTNESAMGFAGKYEQANYYHEYLSDTHPAYDVNFYVEVRNSTRVDEGWLVSTEFSASQSSCNRDATDAGRAVYFINKTTAYRATDPNGDPRRAGEQIANST